MQAIVLVGEEGLHGDQLRSRLPSDWVQYLMGSSLDALELRFEGLRHEWFIHIRENAEPRAVEDDYWTNDLLDPAFRESLGGRSFFSVAFSNGGAGYVTLRALLPSLLRVFARHLDECWIDNDYGVVIRADRFLQKLEGDPSWDWRTATP